MRLSRTDIQKIILDKITGLTHKKDLASETELIESGILTSITIAELAVEVERACGVRFGFAEVSREHFSTPSTICTLVEQKLAHAL